MLQRRAAVLVGYMGAGKTSVGRFVAKQLRWGFIDLDERIAGKAGCSVADIFAREGEPAFRRLETETLCEVISELASADPAIVALGGGAFGNHNNAALLYEFGAPVIWLDAPVQELWQRTNDFEGNRPLRTTLDDFRKRYEERVPAYSFGTFRVNTSGRTVPEVAAEVAWLVGIGCAEKREGQ